MKFTSLTDEARIALGGLYDYAIDVFEPTVRLGVTGLSRAGKTVFITSLVHNLIHMGKLPMFVPYATGKIKRAYLQPQPDDDVPRFAYEDHLAALTGGEGRHWPSSTRRISQLRITVEFEPTNLFPNPFSTNRLNVDIVDYPGEWLLDLTLLDMSFNEWSQSAIEAAQRSPRDTVSGTWLNHLKTIDPTAPASEAVARRAAELFTEYLQACRSSDIAQSSLPPGRFLMPGDFEGSPLLTFAPLPFNVSAQRGSLTEMMERRYNSYVAKVVRPFYMDHFARLDRQVVLVDLLASLNAGPQAIEDLSDALSSVLSSFRPGKTSWLNAVLGKKIDRVLFAATKADQLHHSSHDRLETMLQWVVDGALKRTEVSGAKHEVVALASVRATKEHTLVRNGEAFPSIVGVPIAGETMNGKTYDGNEEIALFPGDLPDDPTAALNGTSEPIETRFLKFRPPVFGHKDSHSHAGLPHIRLDKALNFLLEDRF